MSDSIDRLKEKLLHMEALAQASSQRGQIEGLKRLINQEMEHASHTTLEKVLEFMQFLNYQERELQQDLADARAALEEVEKEGTVSIADLRRELGL